MQLLKCEDQQKMKLFLFVRTFVFGGEGYCLVGVFAFNQMSVFSGFFCKISASSNIKQNKNK
jgi:hypothetical protein